MNVEERRGGKIKWRATGCRSFVYFGVLQQLHCVADNEAVHIWGFLLKLCQEELQTQTKVKLI